MAVNLAEKERRTLAYYDLNAEDWVSSHGGSEGNSYWGDEIARFHELIPSGRILEIGSGGGNEAVLFLSLGYDYTGTDASIGLLEIARRKNPGAKLLHKNVYDLDFPAGSFDGFWAAAVLLHIPKDKMDNILLTIKKQIKPGGIGFISLKQGEGEEVEEETGRLFAYYSQNEAIDVLQRNDYEILESNVRSTQGGTTWINFYISSLHQN